MKNAPSTSTVSIPLDVFTLTAVRAEVKDRADDWRSAWRQNPPSIHPWDPRLVRAEALDSLVTWLDKQILVADRAMELDLDERVSITPLGLEALQAAKKVTTFPRSGRGDGDAA